jgi:hypothetical protein
MGPGTSSEVVVNSMDGCVGDAMRTSGSGNLISTVADVKMEAMLWYDARSIVRLCEGSVAEPRLTRLKLRSLGTHKSEGVSPQP